MDIESNGPTKADLLELLHIWLGFDAETIEWNNEFATALVNCDGADVSALAGAGALQNAARKEVLHACLYGVLERAQTGARTPFHHLDGVMTFESGARFDARNISDEQLIGLGKHHSELANVREQWTLALINRLKSGEKPVSRLVSEWAAIQNGLSEASTKEIGRICAGRSPNSKLN